LRGYFLKDFRLDALYMGDLLSNSGLEQIDNYAKSYNINRSTFLVESALKSLGFSVKFISIKLSKKNHYRGNIF